MKRRLTPKDVASMYGVSVQSIQVWVKNGTLPEPIRLNRRRMYWTEAMLEAFEGNQTVPVSDASAGCVECGRVRDDNQGLRECLDELRETCRSLENKNAFLEATLKAAVGSTPKARLNGLREWAHELWLKTERAGL